MVHSKEQKIAMSIAVISTVLILGILALMFVEKKVQAPTFHTVAESWCKAQGGSFDNVAYSYLPTCTVPVYKGAAGIYDGEQRYEFSFKVVDYDTGLTEVYRQKKQTIREWMDADMKTPAPETVGKFTTKGKYN